VASTGLSFSRAGNVSDDLKSNPLLTTGQHPGWIRLRELLDFDWDGIMMLYFAVVDPQHAPLFGDGKQRFPSHRITTAYRLEDDGRLGRSATTPWVSGADGLGEPCTRIPAVERRDFSRVKRMIERSTLWAMAVGCGLSVANIYYSQPLLAEMGRYFGASDRRMGLVAMLSQVGYATGMLLFLPLGDRLERRSFILVTLGAVTVALIGVAAAPSFAWLAAASLAVGVTTVTPQLLVPFAAHLAEPAERGRVVGTVMSGLLIGILAARTVSGVVGEYLGWRAMYWIAAAVMVALALALKGLLPRSQPESLGISYLGLLRSIGGLVRDEPVLRQSCLFGAMALGPSVPSGQRWHSTSPRRPSVTAAPSWACSGSWASSERWPHPWRVGSPIVAVPGRLSGRGWCASCSLTPSFTALARRCGA
jgi:MFS family permease